MRTKKQKAGKARAKAAKPTSDDDIRSLVCPKCGEPDQVAELDLIPGTALVRGVKADGSLEWSGETEVDWDGQRPASNPAKFVCRACNEKFTGKALGL